MIHNFLRWYGYQAIWGKNSDRFVKWYAITIIITCLIMITIIYLFTPANLNVSIVISCFTLTIVNIIMAILNLSAIGHWDDNYARKCGWIE